MAFTFNTQMQALTHNSAPQKPKPKPNPKPDSASNSTINNSGQIHTRPNYPSQNLIDKYKTPGAFINAQNTMGNQLGIQNVIKPQEQQDIGKNALLEFLQSQNSALESLNKIPELSFQESLELEKALKEMIQKKELEYLDSTAIAELLRKIQQ